MSCQICWRTSELTSTLTDSSHAAMSTARGQWSVTTYTATYCRSWTRTACDSSCRLLRGVRQPAGTVCSTSWSPTERRVDCSSWPFNGRVTYLITTCSDLAVFSLRKWYVGKWRSGRHLTETVHSSPKEDCGCLPGYMGRRVILCRGRFVFAYFNYHACGFVLMGVKI